ncbi:MAG: hypothetical protein OXH67_04350 [Acidimicrobiaceae bacterium]|nr:hypothetical protein [Acidimicrobiaceae bacterium]
MGLPRPEEVIAHRESFLFVDEVTELIPGERARGRWHLRGHGGDCRMVEVLCA